MSWPTRSEHSYEFDGGTVRVCLARDGGLAIKAVEPSGDPVEIYQTTARALAAALLKLADLEGDERLAAMGLAWLQDRRARVVVIAAVESELAALGLAQNRAATWAFVRVADRSELLAIADVLHERATRDGGKLAYTAAGGA